MTTKTKPKYYIVETYHHPSKGKFKFEYDKTKVVSLPDYDEPTHVVVWSAGSIYVFEYHSMNCAYIIDEDGVMIKDCSYYDPLYQTGVTP